MQTKTFILGTLLLAASCANDPAPAHTNGQTESTTQEAPTAQPAGPSIEDAKTIVSDAESNLDQIKKLVAAVTAVPAKTQKAHAEEYADIQSALEAMLEKQETVLTDARKAVEQTASQAAPDTPSTSPVPQAFNEQQAEAIKQCALHTAEYGKLVDEIKGKIAKWQ